jgi:hypothetical protein
LRVRARISSQLEADVVVLVGEQHLRGKKYR